VTTVLAARPGEDAARLLVRAEALDQRLWHLPAPLAQARDARGHLHAGGVSITSVATDVAGLEAAAAAGAALRVRAIVVEGGRLEGRDPEEAADALVRALHAPLVAGAPFVIRNGAGPDALLGFVATEWLLSELPRLGFWFDGSAALARQRAGVGPDAMAWMDAYGTRCGGLFVHGLGAQGLGGQHPGDDGADWDALSSALPAAAPRVLTMDPAHDEAAIADGLRFVRSL